MSLFTLITRATFAAAVAALIAAVGAQVYAQAMTAPPAVTCEQQLEQANRAILDLREANARSEFQNVNLQRAMLDQKKQAEAPHASSVKAADKK